MDFGAITNAATGLQTAGQIVKSLIGLKISAEVQSKIIELQSIIVGAQGDALAAQSEQMTLRQRIQELEAEIAEAKEWKAEKERYQLREFPMGTLAYALRPECANGEPAHNLCARCFNDGLKAPLQVVARHSGGELVECQRCSARLTLSSFNSEPIDYGSSPRYF